MVIAIFLTILGVFFLICSIILFYKSHQIKVEKNIQQETYLNNLTKQVKFLQQDRNNLIKSEVQKKEQLHKEYLQYKQYIQKEKQYYLDQKTENINLKIQQINSEASIEIEAIHKDLNNIRQSATQQKQQIQDEINKLKASLAAGVQARLREQQKKDKINFYKLSIKDSDLADVKILENLKSSLHNPVILSKLIWTQFFQKQTTELCDRILGKNIICGIYKITNLITQQCYIGQSVNIGNRWKQHCKCGLGIDASATNKLYNAMQKDGIWNFTFELLEQCSRQLLNEKEKFWIQMYQSNQFGYNSTKGNL